MAKKPTKDTSFKFKEGDLVSCTWGKNEKGWFSNKPIVNRYKYKGDNWYDVWVDDSGRFLFKQLRTRREKDLYKEAK